MSSLKNKIVKILALALAHQAFVRTSGGGDVQWHGSMDKHMGSKHTLLWLLCCWLALWLRPRYLIISLCSHPYKVANDSSTHPMKSSWMANEMYLDDLLAPRKDLQNLSCILLLLLWSLISFVRLQRHVSPILQCSVLMLRRREKFENPEGGNLAHWEGIWLLLLLSLVYPSPKGGELPNVVCPRSQWTYWHSLLQWSSLWSWPALKQLSLCLISSANVRGLHCQYLR